MKDLSRKIVAYLLLFALLIPMVFGNAAAVYADETQATEETLSEEELQEIIAARTYRRIFIAGDDTVCNWDSIGAGYAVGMYDPKAGWSEMLSFYISDTKALQLQNGANTGFSIETYYTGSAYHKNGTTNQLTGVLAAGGGGQPGDYLLIQFGHNDAIAPNDSMTADEKILAEECYLDIETYKEYLRTYISVAGDWNVTPILVTPIADWNVDASGNFVSSYADYAQAVRDVAAEEGTLLIDMDKKTREFYATLDEEELKRIFMFCEAGEYDTNYADGVEDTTTFQIYGAMHMARLLAEGLKETGDEWLVKNIGNTTLPTAKPAAPEAYVIQSKEKTFNMGWSAVKDAQVYFVYQKVDGEWKLVKQTEGVMYNVVGAIDTDNNEYKVVAMNNKGYSGDSNILVRELENSEAVQETTTKQVVSEEKSDNGMLFIIIIAVVVVVVIVAVVVIVIKKRGSEYEDDEDDDDEYEDDDDEYEDDEDEYEDDEYEDDEYEDDEE